MNSELDDQTIAETTTARSAYIHVPFCRHRCGYCNFTLIAGRSDLHANYIEALGQELSLLQTPRPVDTLFIGGGTPTELSHEHLQQLLKLICQWFPLTAEGEFSLEANPADVDTHLVDILCAAGINRVSLGGQSFERSKLKWLERDHNEICLQNSFELLSKKMDAVSMDLIFGTPGETVPMWEKDVEQLLYLKPKHISTYGLTIEKGTSFFGRLQRGEFELPSEEVQREMYLLSRHKLQSQGYEHYEVSNFSLPGFHCRHSETYWLGAPYYAAGPGAARYIDGRREVNHRSTITYLKKIAAGESVIAESVQIQGSERAREVLVFALRRLRGITIAWFKSTTGFDLMTLCGAQVDRCVQLGLLAWHDDYLRLTEEGLLVSDSIWPELL
ncbi:MAG: radical SAM family heme chaperone HemW [Pirellulales bacterium]|jgi:oxygen-independent coproporphyrinogen-3 oxidase